MTRIGPESTSLLCDPDTCEAAPWGGPADGKPGAGPLSRTPRTRRRVTVDGYARTAASVFLPRRSTANWPCSRSAAASSASSASTFTLFT